jgi:hypothetical protein
MRDPHPAVEAMAKLRLSSPEPGGGLGPSFLASRLRGALAQLRTLAAEDLTPARASQRRAAGLEPYIGIRGLAATCSTA